jgi:hypothetical protein
MYHITSKFSKRVLTGTAVLSCRKVATSSGKIATSWQSPTTLLQKPTESNDRAIPVYPIGHRHHPRRRQSSLNLHSPKQSIEVVTASLKTPDRSSSLCSPSSDHDQQGSNSSSIPTNPVPDFNDARLAYEEKTTWELLRAATCFRLCMIPSVVNNAERLLHYTRFVFGNYIVDQSLKVTMYGHFCAGENEERIKPVLKRLQRVGVGSILDYVAEADQNEQEQGRNGDSGAADEVRHIVEPALNKQNNDQTMIIQAREYNYESEATCDEHVETFLQCIRTVANMGPDGYAAIKVTALGNPKLLARLSTAIEETKRLFATFDENGDGMISRKEFENGCKYVHIYIRVFLGVVKFMTQKSP